MWKAAAGQSVSVAVEDGGDDWETDPDFEVSMTTLWSPSPHPTILPLIGRPKIFRYDYGYYYTPGG